MTRVVVVGARRRRQGTGEFLARWFAAAGAEVAAVVGSTEATAEEARAGLEDRYGIRARAYADTAAALEAERPSVVAISTPFEHHRTALRLAAEAGAHCLCEKPLVDLTAADPEEETAEIATAFARRGLNLSLVTQWPRTLPGFFDLWPEARGQPLRGFEMEMAPMFPGPRMVLDAAPHAISMLEALAGTGRVVGAEARFENAEMNALTLRFRWVHAGGEADVRLALAVKEAAPRPASYAVNGLRVDREIELPEYRMSLVAGDRRLPIHDPLALHVLEFLGRAAARAPADVEGLAASTAALAALAAAVS